MKNGNLMNRMSVVGIFCLLVMSMQAQEFITLDKVVNEWCFNSPTAEKIRLAHENTLLSFENYKKGFLPSVSFALNPVAFNRSLRLMQRPDDGSYSYVVDYSNSSNAGITVQQKIGMTGGVLSMNSNLNVLTEFSSQRNSFSTTPLSVNYSQQLFGGYYTYKKMRDMQRAKLVNSAKQYCSDVADMQTQALNIFLELFLADITRKLALKNIRISDTLLVSGKALWQNGHFTEYEYRQVELQANNNQYVYENAMKEYQKSLRQFWAFLGDKDGTDSVNVVMPEFSLPLSVDYDRAERYTRKNSPFALTLETKRLEAEQALFNARLSNRFNGNVNLSYGLNQYADRFSDAYRKPDYSQGVTLGFQIPIFQWGIGRNKIRMAKNVYRNSMLELEEAEVKFANGLKDEISAYSHNVKLYFLSERSYQLSKQQYEMLSRKFRVGKVSVYELTSAQQELYEAMKKYYYSIQSVWNSFFVLRKLTLYDFEKQIELVDLLLKE